MQKLSEKYRPTTLDKIVGQPKAVKVIGRFIDQGGLGSRAFWLAGPSGTGKTTLARIMAGAVAEELDVTESVARDITPNKVKDMVQRFMYVPLGSCHVWIINEAHGLSKPVIELFLDVLERLTSSAVVIFTTTNAGNDLFEEHIDAVPFASRCVSIKLTNQGLSRPFAERAQKIAQVEGLDGKPIEDYHKLATRCKSNLRAMLGEIESGAMLS